jgi:branched-subunit amino acid transport protein
MDDETPFGQRVFASVMVSTVVGGATALITKNKRNSIIAGFVALAASFIIQ